MHCHLRLPVVPVILSFDQKNRNVSGYQILAKLDDLWPNYCVQPSTLFYSTTSRVQPFHSPHGPILHTHTHTYQILAESGSVQLSYR